MNLSAHQLEKPVISSAGMGCNPEQPCAAVLREEIRSRVATAMNVKSHFVQVEGHSALSSDLLLRCWGKVGQTRFFAKIYLVDPYPITPRFAAPEEELSSTDQTERPVEDQIVAEWNMVQEIRRQLGSQGVPAPLGHSLGERTIVYEQVRGERLDHLVKKGRLGPRDAESVETALFQSGAWLRKLHSTSCQAYETLHLTAVADALRELMRERGLERTQYAALAERALESARPGLWPESSVRVPVALNHGDYSLPNLIWDGSRRYLWVLDFEFSTRRAIVHDLGMMAFELKRLLLYPWASSSTVLRWEESFWAGYGEVSESLFAIVNALAGARIFYHTFPKLLTWRKTRGLWAGMKASIYSRVFEPFVVRRILGMPPARRGGRGSLAGSSQFVNRRR
jgi:aminoglycoside phosphotransferase (APT) family kinase protein